MKSIVLLFTLVFSIYTFGQDSHSTIEEFAFEDHSDLESDLNDVESSTSLKKE